MKRIYLFGIAILMLVIIGIVFYIENSSFNVYVELVGVKESINSPYAQYIFCIVANNGPLPMSATVYLEAGAINQTTPSLFHKEATYVNSTTISVGPFSHSKKMVILWIPLVSSIIFLGVGGTGNYGWHKTITSSNESLVLQIGTLSNFFKIYPPQMPVSVFSTNISLKGIGKYPYEISAYSAAYYFKNNSFYESLNVTLYLNNIKLNPTNTQIVINVNGTKAYSVTLSPQQISSPLSAIVTLDPPTTQTGAVSYSTIYLLTIYIYNGNNIYYIAENMKI